ncbi:MAG: response regulator [Pseudolabrys sp.]|nr:response regulator [Pseudolabrys sp.]MBV9953875.1 response regulator [Pseudolabrys sp.]
MAGAKSRILVVEDEPLVAMMIEDTLIALGYDVIGPAASVGDALALIESEGIDGGLLDVNLGHDERSYPVAERLASRRTPFIFVTGYGAAAIDRRFNAVPVLQKPFGANDLQRHLFAVLRPA